MQKSLDQAKKPAATTDATDVALAEGAKVDRETVDALAKELVQKAKSKKSKKGKKRVAVQSVADPERDLSEALLYVSAWKAGGVAAGWKFNKVKQMWLLQHLYAHDSIPDDRFADIVEYIAGLQGAAKTRTFEQAKGFWDQGAGSSSSDSSSDSDSSDSDSSDSENEADDKEIEAAPKKPKPETKEQRRWKVARAAAVMRALG
ncbi:hypothetical protein BC828DRAFT_392079 [Blastocladiella britannica]|nr:hypothetical protein BC828DRAFT_392079 [Blastocladiella britannica]